VTVVPFRRVPFEALPARPRVPHPFLELPEQRTVLDTPELGRFALSWRTLGQGEPLLLVHGLMTTGYSWRYVIEPLSRHFRVIVPDLVGAGRSDKPDRVLSPEAVADALVAFQRALGIQGCRVLGNSMGGYLALWMALRHPGAMDRLVVGHAPGVPEARLFALWAAMRAPGSEALLGALVRRDARRWAWRNVHYWDESLKSVEEVAEYGDVLATTDGLRGFHRQLRDVMDVRGILRFQRRLREAPPSLPIRLVYARRDPMVPPTVGSALAARLPGAELLWLEHASHFAHIDATDRFLEAVLPFLTSPASTRSATAAPPSTTRT
jgi:pimeloyl-ACP methyl ester carboxylesterase